MSAYDDISQLYYCECGCGKPLQDWSYGLARADRNDIESRELCSAFVLPLSCNSSELEIVLIEREYGYKIGIRRNE